DRLEVMKARIERRHVFRAIEIQLAPMRSCSVLPEDRVDVEEIAPIVDPRAAGDGDRHAGALVKGAQHARIASDETIFHRSLTTPRTWGSTPPGSKRSRPMRRYQRICCERSNPFTPHFKPKKKCR